MADVRSGVSLELTRFLYSSESPPSIRSRSTEPDDPFAPVDKEQERVERHQAKLFSRPLRSRPTEMFRRQIVEEVYWLRGIQYPNLEYYIEATEESTKNIRDLWIRWGIWRDEWDGGRFPYEYKHNRWAHEVDLGPEPEPESEPNDGPQDRALQPSPGRRPNEAQPAGRGRLAAPRAAPPDAGTPT